MTCSIVSRLTLCAKCRPVIPNCRATAHAIAVGALSYFLLKFTRNSVIVFDFKEALSFEGETGPYCQYAAVRANSIFKKLDVRTERGSDRIEGNSLAAAQTLI